MSFVYRIQKFFRRLFLISRLFDRVDAQERLVKDLIDSYDYLKNEIGERTVTHADIHYLQSSQVIVIGRYGGKDFVKSYPVQDKDIRELIKILRNMETNSRVGRIDMPSGMNFSTLYEQERF